ncbi:hypothetical protein BT96DRAFT_798850, partial [Gymnopus androsaceus JB14]
NTNSAAIIDSRATGLFINQHFIEQHHIQTQQLPHPITLYNVNGTPNTAGQITHSV